MSWWYNRWMKDIPHPDLDLGPAWWASYQRKRRVGKLVASTPLALSALSLAHKALGSLNRAYRVIHIAKREGEIERECRRGMPIDSPNPVAFGSGFGYDDEKTDFKVADDYRRDLLEVGSKSRILFERSIETIAGLIETQNISRVINFGACFGWMDSELARRFPSVSFVGIDRAPSVKALNDSNFKLPNLEFVAADIFPWLKDQTDLRGALFFHIRTAVLLPEKTVRDLYALLALKHCECVFGAETYGIPRQTDQIYIMDLTDKASVYYRSRMFIHNYPGLLAANGFDMSSLEWITLPKREEGQRIVSFTAKRTL